jgi:hypothetical protein
MNVDKHKIWLIAIAVVAILAFGFLLIYPSLGDAEFVGQAIKSVGEDCDLAVDEACEMKLEPNNPSTNPTYENQVYFNVGQDEYRLVYSADSTLAQKMIVYYKKSGETFEMFGKFPILNNPVSVPFEPYPTITPIQHGVNYVEFNIQPMQDSYSGTSSLLFPSSLLNGKSDFTIDFMIKTAATSQSFLISAVDPQGAASLLMKYEDSRHLSASGLGPDPKIEVYPYGSPKQINDGEWHHVVFTRDFTGSSEWGPTVGTLYFDDVLVGSLQGNSDQFLNVQNLVIGGHPASSALLNGEIKDVKIIEGVVAPLVEETDYCTGTDSSQYYSTTTVVTNQNKPGCQLIDGKYHCTDYCDDGNGGDYAYNFNCQDKILLKKSGLSCAGNFGDNYICNQGACVEETVIVEADADGDGVGDSLDNCPNVVNPGQENVDGTGQGDACQECLEVGIITGTSFLSPVQKGREEACISVGCTFVGKEFGSSIDLSNDLCLGVLNPGSCPDVSKYAVSGSGPNNQRKDLCESVGCTFKNRAGDSASSIINNQPQVDECYIPASSGGACTEDYQCETGLNCLTGVCGIVETVACVEDSSCEAGSVCIQGVCQVGLSTSKCVYNEGNDGIDRFKQESVTYSGFTGWNGCISEDGIEVCTDYCWGDEMREFVCVNDKPLPLSDNKECSDLGSFVCSEGKCIPVVGGLPPADMCPDFTGTVENPEMGNGCMIGDMDGDGCVGNVDFNLILDYFPENYDVVPCVFTAEEGDTNGDKCVKADDFDNIIDYFSDNYDVACEG